MKKVKNNNRDHAFEADKLEVNLQKTPRMRKLDSYKPAARYSLPSQTPRLPASPKQPSILMKDQKHQIIEESSWH